jgi:hypothetical protein
MLSQLLHRETYWTHGSLISALIDTRRRRLIAEIVKDEDDYYVTIFHAGPLARFRMWWNHPHDGDMRPLFYGPLEFCAPYGSMIDAVIAVNNLLQRLGITSTTILARV